MAFTLEYVEKDTFLHKLDIRTKILFIILLTVLAMYWTDIVYIIPLLIFVHILCFAVRMPLRKVWKLVIAPLVPVFITIMLMTSFLYPVTLLHHDWAKVALLVVCKQVPVLGISVECTVGGIMMGLSFILKMIIIIVISSLLTYSSPVSHFLLFMQWLRLPSELAFVMGTAIRLMPTFLREVRTVTESQKVRGLDFRKLKGMKNKIQGASSILIPTLASTSRRTDNMAMAMVARAYGAVEKRSSIYKLEMKKKDYFLCILMSLITGCLIYLYYTANMGIL